MMAVVKHTISPEPGRQTHFFAQTRRLPSPPPPPFFPLPSPYRFCLSPPPPPPPPSPPPPPPPPSLVVKLGRYTWKIGQMHKKYGKLPRVTLDAVILMRHSPQGP